MRQTLQLLPAIVLFIVNSCSFANKSTVTVPIHSNPLGANVLIDGKRYGQTPTFVELKPNKNYKATISKQGYSPVNIDIDAWYSMRGGKSADGGRCMADVASFILPYFIVLLFAPEKCGSFKQSDYFVDLVARQPAMSEVLEPKTNLIQPYNSQNNYYHYNQFQNQGSQYRYGGSSGQSY